MQLQFMKKLVTNTQSETIFATVNDYLHEKGIPLSNMLQIATNGASAMTKQA